METGNDATTIEEASSRLCDGDLTKEREILLALRAAKIAAYHEMLIAARFHASPMGQGIDGLIAGIKRAIAAADAEAFGR